MLRLNPQDDEAFMNKLWFQKWVCDWRGWGSDMRRLRRVLDAYKTKGVFGCCACLLKGMMVPFLCCIFLSTRILFTLTSLLFQHRRLPVAGGLQFFSCILLILRVASSPLCYLPFPSHPLTCYCLHNIMHGTSSERQLKPQARRGPLPSPIRLLL